jgi:DNA-binding response OmpR family regulator
MHIVLVEDNKVLAESIISVLSHEGYSTTGFSDGKEAYIWLENNATVCDGIILDVLLPGLSGFEICRHLRNKNITVPILMLTSKDESQDIVDGLDSGADDYLKKPFVFDELLARLRSLVRRRPHFVEAVMELTPHVRIDLLAHQVYKDGKEIHLTAREFGILEYFLHKPNQIITQQEIYDHVFDFVEVQLSNTIEVHIKNLRKKLRAGAVELPIVTVRNVGYRLVYDK